MSADGDTSLRDVLLRLWDHLAWSAETLQDRMDAVAAGDDEPPAEARRLHAHLVYSERVWMDRIARGASDHPVWPAEDALPSVAELRSLHRETRQEARALLVDGELDLRRRVSYRTSSGTPFDTQLSDILLHLALHGAHHRGQIARSLRGAGLEPVNTDYVTWVRSRRRDG